MESPVRWKPHAGFGERPGETDQQQCRHRAPGRLHRSHREGSCARSLYRVCRDPVVHVYARSCRYLHVCPPAVYPVQSL